MSRPPDNGWTGGRLAIGKALLLDDRSCLTSAEIAEATGKRPQNVGHLADRLVDEGLLERVPAPMRRGARGRPPTKAYALPDEQQESLRQHLAGQVLGVVRRGQQLIFAEAGPSDYVDLMGVLAETKAISQASWSALWQADRSVYVVAFEDEDGIEPASELMAALSAAEISFRRSSVDTVLPVHDLVDHARRARRVADKTAFRRRARGAAAS